MTDSSNEPTQPARDGQLSEAEKDAYVRSTRRFDLRRILGALFVLYGIIVTLTGVAHHATDGDKTGGIQINLWTGIAMIIAGGLFFLWDRLAPVPREDILDTLEREGEERAAGEGREL